jgi:hypothetical protein
MSAAPAAAPCTPTLALEWLYESVRARFNDEGPAGVAQPFGWREVAKHHVGPRIVWVPGDPLGDVGRHGPPRSAGGGARSLATLYEQFHVVISNNDESAPENERLQYRATRLLYDYWLRAVILTTSVVAVEAAEWLTAKLERRFGTSMRITCTIQSAIPDVPGEWTYAPPGVDAEIVVNELDVAELNRVEVDP